MREARVSRSFDELLAYARAYNGDHSGAVAFRSSQPMVAAARGMTRDVRSQPCT
jgi:hypothetical protein